MMTDSEITKDIKKEIKVDQASTLRVRMKNEKTFPPILAIASGKGGVGKSSIAVNLCCQIAKSGKKVLLFDADFGLGNTDILLGIHATATLEDVLKEGKRIEEIALLLEEGVMLVPAGSGSFHTANVNQSALEGVLLEVERFANHFDVVVFDTGAGIGERVRDTLLFADKILIITTPDPASLTDSYATIKTVVGKDPSKKFSIIVNRAETRTQGDKVFAQIAQVASKYLHIELDSWGMIPEDSKMQMAARRQKPAVTCYPGTPASLAFERLAARAIKFSENSSEGVLEDSDSGSVKVFGGFLRQLFNKGESRSDSHAT